MEFDVAAVSVNISYVRCELCHRKSTPLRLSSSLVSPDCWSTEFDLHPFSSTNHQPFAYVGFVWLNDVVSQLKFASFSFENLKVGRWQMALIPPNLIPC